MLILIARLALPVQTSLDESATNVQLVSATQFLWVASHRTLYSTVMRTHRPPSVTTFMCSFKRMQNKISRESPFACSKLLKAAAVRRKGRKTFLPKSSTLRVQCFLIYNLHLGTECRSRWLLRALHSILLGHNLLATKDAKDGKQLNKCNGLIWQGRKNALPH